MLHISKNCIYVTDMFIHVSTSLQIYIYVKYMQGFMSNICRNDHTFSIYVTYMYVYVTYICVEISYMSHICHIYVGLVTVFIYKPWNGVMFV